MTETRPTSDREAINVRGVIAIRWVAVVGQLLTIVTVDQGLRIPLPMTSLLLVLGGTAAVNLGLVILYGIRPPGNHETPLRWPLVLGLTMLFDLLALALLLYFTGGMTNPFYLFFFVNLVLSAILLSKPWIWALNALAIGCAASLYVVFQPIPILTARAGVREYGAIGPLPLDVVQFGSLVAFAASATVIVFFTSYITGQLRRHDLQLRELSDVKARSERVEALGTLAAGAAHELGTPLSSIAVISEEVEQELASNQVTEQTLAGIRTIRSELRRCRRILDRMSTDAGLAIGESISRTTVGELVRESLNELGTVIRVVTKFEGEAESAPLLAPRHRLAQAIRGLLQNAIDATSGERVPECRVRVDADWLHLCVEDHGQGMDEDTLRRVGQPFFTTKQLGKGTGLGVFLARNVIEGLGGTLDIASTPGRGTRVQLTLPRGLRQLGG